MISWRAQLITFRFSLFTYKGTPQYLTPFLPVSPYFLPALPILFRPSKYNKRPSALQLINQIYL
jgi:hypothetical protein